MKFAEGLIVNAGTINPVFIQTSDLHPAACLVGWRKRPKK